MKKTDKKAPYAVLKASNIIEHKRILKDYEKISETAKRTGYSYTTLRLWVKKRLIEGFVFEGNICIKKKTVLPPKEMKWNPRNTKRSCL